MFFQVAEKSAFFSSHVYMFRRVFSIKSAYYSVIYCVCIACLTRKTRKFCSANKQLYKNGIPQITLFHNAIERRNLFCILLLFVLRVSLCTKSYMRHANLTQIELNSSFFMVPDYTDRIWLKNRLKKRTLISFKNIVAYVKLDCCRPSTHTSNRTERFKILIIIRVMYVYAYAFLSMLVFFGNNYIFFRLKHFWHTKFNDIFACLWTAIFW